jgi:hypothetical protein
MYRHVYTLVLILFLSPCGPALAGPRPMPRLEGLTNYGCTIRQHGEAWELEAWASHEAPKDWKDIASRRTGRNARRKIFSDCDDYMTAVQKAVQKFNHRVGGPG